MSGKITVDGKPLTTGVIFVAPDHGRAAGGKIGRDGSFTLSTYDPGDGVLRGTHRVQVVSFEQLSPTQRRWFVPKDVRELSTTHLQLDVTVPTASADITIATNGEKPEVETIAIGGD